MCVCARAHAHGHKHAWLYSCVCDQYFRCSGVSISFCIIKLCVLCVCAVVRMSLCVDVVHACVCVCVCARTHAFACICICMNAVKGYSVSVIPKILVSVKQLQLDFILNR